MTAVLILLIAACVTTWFKTRRRTCVRVAQGIRLELERRERAQRLKRNAIIALVVLGVIVIMAVTR